ncbi:MAG TPA: dihydropteroate synthase [Longimicrobiales bacterium]|nr:dihydropteroate synthase [Longimicrobiales bacterium]
MARASHGGGAVVSARPSPRTTWRVGDRTLDVSRPVVMGILNMTPDSFSDGGELAGVDDALSRAETMVEAGAGLLDVGGESTRPGAPEVPADEEIRRVVPFVEAASRRFDVPLSVDTRKAAVARAALEAGASVVNDVSGLAWDPDMAAAAARGGAGVVVMHMRGTPATMQEHAVYEDVTGSVVAELGEALQRARAAGIPAERVVVDPGIGFAKTPEQNLVLLRELPRLTELGHPILVGPSRKSFLGHLLRVRTRERLAGTLASCVLAYLGGARLFRVHDVAPAVQALTVARAVAGEVREAGGRASSALASGGA